MFVFLSKFLPVFVYPVGLACLCILAALLTRRSHPRLKNILLFITLAVLWLGGNRWVSQALARSLEWRYLPPAEIPEADILVLLGGGTQPSEYPRSLVEVNEAGDRILYAAWLYRQGKADYILASGGLLDWSSRQNTPAQDMAFLLEMMGVPKEAIWLQPDSRNTYEDALFSAEILNEKGIHRILLVTSASHMLRSVKLFEAQGFDVTPLPTDYSVSNPPETEPGKFDPRPFILSLFPNADNLATTTRILKEYIGIWMYDLRGWL
jgi:uncharacterized SAM-binding protein YcdF (DUF218 family)